jgi:hypothetical protein
VVGNLAKFSVSPCNPAISINNVPHLCWFLADVLVSQIDAHHTPARRQNPVLLTAFRFCLYSVKWQCTDPRSHHNGMCYTTRQELRMPPSILRLPPLPFVTQEAKISAYCAVHLPTHHATTKEAGNRPRHNQNPPFVLQEARTSTHHSAHPPTQDSTTGEAENQRCSQKSRRQPSKSIQHATGEEANTQRRSQTPKLLY